MESERLQPVKRRSWGHLLGILGIFFVIEVLSFGDIVEIIPLFAPVVASPIFPYFHEIHDLLATGLVLLAAYKYHARIGVAAILVYFAIHIPYFIIQSDEWPENAMEITHVLLSSFVGFLGIWLINQLRHSEKKLRVSEERYRSTLENMMEGCQIIGFDWRYLYVNESAAKHGRRTKEELLGHTMMEVYPGIENTEMFANLRRCLESRIPHQMENLFAFPDGSQGWFELSIEPVPDGIFILSLDITERKRAEERINHLTDVLKAVRNVNQLITHEKGREGLIRKSCDLLVQRGYQRAWILLLDENKKSGTVAGKGFDKDTSVFLQQLEMGDYPECLRELMAQGQAIIAYNRPGRRHKGCVLAGSHSGQDVVRGKLEHDGKLYGVMGVSIPQGIAFDKAEQELFFELCSDIGFALASIESENKRKQAEEILRLSEENFRHSMDDSPLGIRIVNAGGETIYANRVLLDIYGRDSLEELKRTPNKDIYTPESYAEHRERVEKRQRGEYVPSTYEISIVRKDGKIRHIEVIRKEVLWNSKPQFQMLCRDITEIKQMQEQLIMQDRLVSIGQLVSGVAHELNNPLTSVIGFSELLLQRELSDDLKEDLKIVNDEAKRTSLIVRNLLSFARQQPQEKQAIDINDPIQVVLRLRNHEHNVNNIKVDTHLAPDLPQIMGNGSQLQQVFLNIVTNAEFAMTEAHNKGTLTITTERTGNSVRASFADDGHGILKEHMTHLFSPFFTTKPIGKGTGLGLSICHGIVTEHGGRIWAESEPGQRGNLYH